MLSPDLITELKDIAFSTKAKPANRVSALSSLARNGIEHDAVRQTLYSIATDILTPDSVKVRAIDLLDKLNISEPPRQLSAEEARSLEESLREKYVTSS